MRGITSLESTEHKTPLTKGRNPCDFLAGFTLIETIIYIGLFAILISGVIVSIQPILAGAERMSEKVMIENEITLVSRTITSLIPQAQSVTAPSVNTTGNTLTLTTYSGQTYTFSVSGGAVISRITGAGPTPINATLTASRVRFDSISVTHTLPTDGTPRYLELSYVVDGETYGPIRSYLNF